jgi:uncharacterized short protein YbdD (DUF466 family)
MRPESDERAGIRSRVRALGAVLRQIFGMPDYDGYLEHRRAAHPDEPVMSRAEYFADHLAWRYGGGPTRCC